MKNVFFIACFTFVFSLFFNIPAVFSINKTTDEDQIALEVTVYNSNIGLVKDTRIIPLEKGEGELRFMDVAAHIIPQTVYVTSLDYPDDFNVLEQNYEYDLISQEKLLDKYLGKKIKIIDDNKFQDRKDTIEATLLSNNMGEVYKINDEIYLGHPGIKVLPEIPENLIAEPTLMWLYETTRTAQQKIEASYLTNNINWKADYVVVLKSDDTVADLSGWVTIDNKSGTTYKNSSLKLVAGDINRVIDERMRYKDQILSRELAAVPAGSGFEEEAFFEYHLYDLQRKTTVKNNQTKQIRLLQVHDIQCTKDFRVYGRQNWYYSQYNRQDPRQAVEVYFLFMNSEENKLGMPLPAGVMRLYKKDSKDSQQFIGEDRIKHTPRDEKVELKIGEAFDIVAERRQMDYKRITTKLFESEWELTLRNHKKEAVTVSIIEPVSGNWKVISNSHPFVKKDAFHIQFDVQLNPDEEVKVKYRLQVGV